jgi:cobalamin biosynthesis Mg chelatase CobN
MATKTATKPAADRTTTSNRTEPGAKAAARSASRDEGRTVETAQEARGAEPGPSVLALLTVSTIAAGFVLAIIWFMFFRT